MCNVLTVVNVDHVEDEVSSKFVFFSKKEENRQRSRAKNNRALKDFQKSLSEKRKQFIEQHRCTCVFLTM